MPKQTLKIILVVLMLSVLSSGYAPAAPVEATLYPTSALINEIQKVRLKETDNRLSQAVFIIPGQADPETLVTKIITPQTMKVMDQRWRQITRQDEDAVLALKKELDGLKKEHNRLQADIKALDTQLQFWQLQTKARMKTVADAGNMSTAIGRNMKKTMQDKLALEPLLAELAKKIKEREDNLIQTSGRKETSWEVTVILAGAATPEATLAYGYVMAGCGWSSLYRLEAQPRQQRLRFTWDAEIWQSSGLDWRHVNIRLATLQPRKTIVPGEIPPWIIKPRERLFFRPQKADRSALAREAMTVEAAEENAGAAPTLTRQSAFHVWEIGKRNLAAGQRQRIQIREEEWPVEFLHLARPSQGEEVYFRGVVKFDEDREIPEGTALFLIDGALVGKRPFALTGREGTVFFGTDPLVKATAVLLDKAAGEKTLFADKQTFRWEWRIDVVNARGHAVQVRVEEPRPQSRDERIQIVLKSEPAPVTTTPDTQVWLLEVPAGAKRQLLTSVTLEAPKNLPLDMGWRR
ncbi:MAG TPA: DUF4139 domain-containing protein [Syntrophales bacterium]|jgi:uncharacterized protein (TIGR02231 family)|nr:DUF4139 domain-containing protein [Syntrophales bacterium]HOU76606.1 DUF4139 domain-containing protein [Syntrophales bacterium]HPC31363.1 DUF4139 domain-containing protein [Syntrophales bacterium]HQG33269.1 DUF4139 domain-containing protein [Syntrophales bacterium]HQI35045.1 DUF4139 domain-containing protein [Syntrophales bacterium]